MRAKIQVLEKCKEDLTEELEESTEQNDLLEFRILELEQSQDEVGFCYSTPLFSDIL